MVQLEILHAPQVGPHAVYELLFESWPIFVRIWKLKVESQDKNEKQATGK